MMIYFEGCGGSNSDLIEGSANCW